MSNEIIVLGGIEIKSTNYATDRGRVLSGWGICTSIRSTDWKDPPKILVKVQHERSERDREHC